MKSRWGGGRGAGRGTSDLSYDVFDRREGEDSSTRSTIEVAQFPLGWFLNDGAP